MLAKTLFRSRPMVTSYSISIFNIFTAVLRCFTFLGHIYIYIYIYICIYIYILYIHCIYIPYYILCFRINISSLSFIYNYRLWYVQQHVDSICAVWRAHHAESALESTCGVGHVVEHVVLDTLSTTVSNMLATRMYKIIINMICILFCWLLIPYPSVPYHSPNSIPLTELIPYRNRVPYS